MQRIIKKCLEDCRDYFKFDKHTNKEIAKMRNENYTLMRELKFKEKELGKKENRVQHKRRKVVTRNKNIQRCDWV